MNRTQIIGNLGQDAQVRVLDSGQAAIAFSVGVTERWMDKQGVKQERTDWFSCTLWKPQDKTAIAQYLKKGTKVLVEGRIAARAWNGQDGSLNASLELRVENIEFLSSQAQAQPQAQPAAGVTPEAMTAAPAQQAKGEGWEDPDLPF
jgi:single-strand DNA-binding protein